MKRSAPRTASPDGPVLGIEGGGSRTVALLCSPDGRLLQRWEGGPANVRLLDDAALRRRFREIASALPRPSAIGIALAGAREERDRERIRAAAASLWPGVPCVATHDLDSALAAAGWRRGAARDVPRVLVLSGTGSCCYARTPDGRTARLGGWGHLIGDKGSAYEIGLRALKAVVYYLDRDGTWSNLGQRILRTLLLNEPDALIGWVRDASKQQVAALAVEVFAAARERDRIAADILEGAAHGLARDAVDCAAKLVKKGSPVEFVFAGGVLLGQPRFRSRIAADIRRRWPGASCGVPDRESAWGAVALAMHGVGVGRAGVPGTTAAGAPNVGAPGAAPAGEWVPRATALSPTETRNPRSSDLHRLPLDRALRLFLSEEARVVPALLAEAGAIERAVRLIAAALRRGGRLFYVGAGTSGRLGVLDASECPPTFRTDPELVQGIIAGGQTALWRAVEGAEDDFEAGGRALGFRGVTARDVVVGIAASGRTRFVWGAIAAARNAGARTVLVCFNPHLAMARNRRPDVVIAPDLGPEVLTGSTRLKAGTATKLVLNLFSTLAMVRMGKVVGNLMVDLNPSNTKLRERAIRIVVALTGCEESAAREALARSGWVVKEAWRRLETARRRGTGRSGRRG